MILRIKIDIILINCSKYFTISSDGKKMSGLKRRETKKMIIANEVYYLSNVMKRSMQVEGRERGIKSVLWNNLISSFILLNNSCCVDQISKRQSKGQKVSRFNLINHLILLNKAS